MSKKSLLRKEFLQVRASRPHWQAMRRDMFLQRILIDLLQELKISNVLGYAPFRDEPELNLINVCHDFSWQLWLPVVQAEFGQMIFRRYDASHKLVANQFGIFEPEHTSQEFDMQRDKPAALVIPAVAADRAGYRLGYGGGYYDRFLESFPNIPRIAIVDSQCIVESLPRDSHDQPMNYVITELGASSRR